MENLEQKAGGNGLSSRAWKTAKNIGNYVKKPIVYGTLITALAVGACAKEEDASPSGPGGNSDTSHYPVASLQISPDSGNSPLDVNIKLNCFDEDRDMNIYGIATNSETIEQNSPINVNRTFTNNATIEGYCIDETGREDSKIKNVTVFGTEDLNVDFSGTNLDITEAEAGTTREKTVDLPNTDMNGNPLTYTGAVSNNPSISVLVYQNNGNWKVDLTADDAVSEETQYSVEFDVNGETKTHTGTLENLFEMSGTLEDNESDSPVDSGEIRAYAIPGGKRTDSENTFVNSQGQFYLETTEPVGEVLVQHASTSGNSLTSYVRSRKFDGSKDIQGDLVRVVPLPSYQGLDINGEDGVNNQDDIDFKEHATELDVPINRWNYGGLYGAVSEGTRFPKVEILKENPLGEPGTFNSDQRNDIATQFQNVGCDADERSLEVQIDNQYPPTNPHYTIENGNIMIDSGWIIVAPHKIIDGGTAAGSSTEWTDETNFNRAYVKMDSDLTAGFNSIRFVAEHEKYHAMGFEHAQTLGISDTLMRPDSDKSINSLTGADCKVYRMAYEETYKPGEGAITVDINDHENGGVAFLERDFYK